MTWPNQSENGTFPPLEVTQYYLNRIAQQDQIVGSFCHLAPETAIAISVVTPHPGD